MIDNNLVQLKADMWKIIEKSNMSCLTINFAKTKIVHFGSKAKKITTNREVGGYQIEGVNSYKYLGYLLDQELNFKSELKQTIRTVSQKYYMF